MSAAESTSLEQTVVSRRQALGQFGEPVARFMRTETGSAGLLLAATLLALAWAMSGIGFTISLFIVDLALDDPALQDEARVGVLAASLLAAILGWALFRAGERWGRAEADPRGATVLDPPVDPARDHVRGPVDAPLTLVEYGDFECPFCGRATGAVEELHERFGDRLRYVFRHVPLTDVHPAAHQDALEPHDLLAHAGALDRDVDRFERDLLDGRHAARVRDDALSAEAGGVRGTPTFFVGGRPHTGPTDAATLGRVLDDAAAGGPR